VTIPDKARKFAGITETQIGTIPLIPMRKRETVCMKKVATRKDVPLNFFLSAATKKHESCADKIVNGT
jgi:hypothetical protein